MDRWPAKQGVWLRELRSRGCIWIIWLEQSDAQLVSIICTLRPAPNVTQVNLMIKWDLGKTLSLKEALHPIAYIRNVALPRTF